MRQAIDQPSRDWIRSSHHDNRNRLGRLLGCAEPCCNYKDIYLELHEFGHKAWVTVQLSFDVAILNEDVFSLNITEISQPLLESLDRRPGGGASS
jgi:hypothetical protein